MLNNVNKHEHFKLQIKQITDFLSDGSTKIILGDFNLDYEKRNVHNYANRRIYDELLEAVTAFDLVQLVKEKTWARVYNNNDVRMSTLDHVYTNNIEGVETVTVLKQEISDHSLVMIETVGLVRERVKEYFTYVC